jgi:O-antigen/teichoic acid export membrane protein
VTVALDAPAARPSDGNAWGLADHALLSAASVVTLVVLARVLDTRSFGLFVLVYATLLFANMLQSALITQPHNVLGGVRLALGADYKRFTSSTAAGQLLFTSVATAGALVAAAVAALGHHDATAKVVFALAPALAAWQVQELLRRILYTERRFAVAFATDVVSYGGQLLAILVLWHEHALSAPRALYVIAVTSAAGAALGAWVTRGSFERGLDPDVLRANWRFGRWLAGSAVGVWLSSHLYFYLVALLIGGASSGALKASQIVLGPLNVLLLFLTTVLPSRLARAAAGSGPDGVRRLLGRTFVTTGPVVVGYCAAVVVFADVLLKALYGSRYADDADVVGLFAAYYLVLYTGQLAAAALMARGQTKVIFASSIVAGTVGLVAGWSFIETMGLRGAVVGMIVGAIAANAITWNVYRRPDPGSHELERHVLPEPREGALTAR